VALLPLHNVKVRGLKRSDVGFVWSVIYCRHLSCFVAFAEVQGWFAVGLPSVYRRLYVGVGSVVIFKLRSDVNKQNFGSFLWKCRNNSIIFIDNLIINSIFNCETHNGCFTYGYEIRNGCLPPC
jgi:hypothetical protein